MRPAAPTVVTRRAFLASAALLAFAGRGRAAPAGLGTLLGPALEAAGRFATSHGGQFGACFLDARTGEELASLHGDVPDNPASNEKLVTAAAALRLLGPDQRFETALYGRPVNGRIERLVLRGEGDPSLSSADLTAFAGDLRTRGVKEVGDILVDQSAFEERFVPPGFEQQPDEWAAFRAPVSAVAVDRNSVLITIAPTTKGLSARVGFEPSGFVNVEGDIETVAKGTRALPRVGLSAKGQHLAARLSGSIAEGADSYRYRQRVDDPRLLAGYVLREGLASVGIAVGGTIRLGGADESREIVSHESATLAELLPELGKASDNFYAEMVLRALGRRSRGRPATSAAGAAAAIQFLKDIGAWEDGQRVTNGSGLFDSNRVTPRCLSRVLVAMTNDATLGPHFRAQLSVGGVDGTLKSRFRSPGTRGAVLGKTGTLRDVVALSGYVLGADNRPSVAFSCLMSGIAGRTGAARQAMDRIVGIAVGEARRSSPDGARAAAP